MGKSGGRREISPAQERSARDGCPGGARCPCGRDYADFTSVMTQWHEWGHQSDLKQPSQAQGIFNLAVVACFGRNALPWLQKRALFAPSTTTSPGQERKGPFWMKIQILDSKICKFVNLWETKKHNQGEKGAFLGQNTKNWLPAPIFWTQLSNVIWISFFSN